MPISSRYRRMRRIILAITALAYLAFLLFYGFPRTPLSEADIEAGLAKASAAMKAHGRAEDPLLRQELVTLLRGDDGDEFINVNLIRYRKRAMYPPGSPYDDDPRAADARYNAMVIPELLIRGGMPIFMGSTQGRFIHPEGADDWDTTALVRYRSRRDMLEMAVALAEKNGDIHKWAAIEKTHVFPAKTTFALYVPRLLVAVVLFGIAALILRVLRWVERRKRERLS